MMLEPRNAPSTVLKVRKECLVQFSQNDKKLVQVVLGHVGLLMIDFFS